MGTYTKVYTEMLIMAVSGIPETNISGIPETDISGTFVVHSRTGHFEMAISGIPETDISGTY